MRVWLKDPLFHASSNESRQAFHHPAVFDEIIGMSFDRSPGSVDFLGQSLQLTRAPQAKRGLAGLDNVNQITSNIRKLFSLFTVSSLMGTGIGEML